METVSEQLDIDLHFQEEPGWWHLFENVAVEVTRLVKTPKEELETEKRNWMMIPSPLMLRDQERDGTSPGVGKIRHQGGREPGAADGAVPASAGLTVGEAT